MNVYIGIMTDNLLSDTKLFIKNTYTASGTISSPMPSGTALSYAFDIPPGCTECKVGSKIDAGINIKGSHSLAGITSSENSAFTFVSDYKFHEDT